ETPPVAVRAAHLSDGVDDPSVIRVAARPIPVCDPPGVELIVEGRIDQRCLGCKKKSRCVSPGRSENANDIELPSRAVFAHRVESTLDDESPAKVPHGRE